MIIKIGVGLIGHSYALIADGIESARDIFTSTVTWAGFRWSLKPPDEDHPYGYGKIDALSGIFSGTCLLGAAAWIAYESILDIRTPHHLPAWFMAAPNAFTEPAAPTLTASVVSQPARPTDLPAHALGSQSQRNRAL